MLRYDIAERTQAPLFTALLGTTENTESTEYSLCVLCALRGAIWDEPNDDKYDAASVSSVLSVVQYPRHSNSRDWHQAMLRYDIAERTQAPLFTALLGTTEDTESTEEVRCVLCALCGAISPFKFRQFQGLEWGNDML